MTESDEAKMNVSEERSKKKPKDSRAGEAWGAALTRDTSIYVIGAVIGFVLALISIAVVTRFLSVAQFGQLALLLTFAAFLTIIYNVGTLQGTFVWVFGSAGEEDVADEDVESSQAGTKRRALGTGLIITTVITLGGTLIIVAASSWFADKLLGNPGDADLIIIAAISGASGALWRLVTNILRMERKPKRFVALQSVRPVLVVAGVITFTAAGMGVKGAILGTAVGGIASVLVGLIATRHSYVLRLDRMHARMILKRGGIFVPILISLWIAQNVDVYAVSYFTNDDRVVGLYRLAGRFGAFLDYFTAALFMAWTPLVQTPTFAAAVKSRGKEALGGRLLTYFVMVGLLLILLMTAAAEGLVHIAPPAYAAAAPLIPVIGGGFLSYGLFISVYRLSAFPKKRAAYVAAAITSAVVFLGSAPLLVPWLGAYGAALCVINGFAVAALGLTVLSQRGPTPLEIEWRRIAGCFALAGLALVIARVVGPAAGGYADTGIEAGAVVVYVIGLFVTGVISKEDREAARRFFRLILPSRWVRSPEIEDGLRGLGPENVSALEKVIVRGWTPKRLVQPLDARQGEAEARMVGLLRKLDGGSEPTEHDARIGEYLFEEMTIAEHDELGRSLWEEDVEPEDLHSLEGVVRKLHGLPKRAWAEAGANGGPAREERRWRLLRRRRSGGELGEARDVGELERPQQPEVLASRGVLGGDHFEAGAKQGDHDGGRSGETARAHPEQ
jgi:O-antigen/teichoic acid export membrane protein